MFSFNRSISLGILLLLFLVGGWYFTSAQNSGALPGGQIALVKLFWLGLIIFIWYIMPLLLLSYGTSNRTQKLILWLHFGNVMGRGLIELFMVYFGANWQPIYGISHDLFSMLLIGILLIVYLKHLNSMIKTYLSVLTATFLVESLFATYMLQQVSSHDGPVYFVPAANQYQLILMTTWVAVISLAIYLLTFFKRWLSTHA